MKTSLFPRLPHVLCTAFAWLALSSPAHAGDNGIKLLIHVTQEKSRQANEQARQTVAKPEVNLHQKELAVQRRGEPSAPQEDASPASDAGRVVQDVAAVVEFESTAGGDGLDDAELKRLAELVAAAEHRVSEATAHASNEIAGAKKRLKETKAPADKERIKHHLKSLRATVKAHKQTSSALRALAKKVST